MIEMSPREREYYRRYHGFDPVLDKIRLDPAGTRFRYQAYFPLVNDPTLFNAGVAMMARVEVDVSRPPNEGGIQNWILFTRGEKEAGYECKHTIICTIAPDTVVDGTGDAALPLLEIAKTHDRPKIRLPPEEHFAALKAFAREFAAEGLEHIVRQALTSEHLRPDILPIGFTAKMQKALFGALWQLAPAATRAIVGNIILEIADTLPRAEFESLLPMLDDIYNLRRGVLQDPTFAREVMANSGSEKLKQLAILASSEGNRGPGEFAK